MEAGVTGKCPRAVDGALRSQNKDCVDADEYARGAVVSPHKFDPKCACCAERGLVYGNSIEWDGHANVQAGLIHFGDIMGSKSDAVTKSATQP